VNAKPRGRQFFNNPGPTNIPDRVLRAMDRPVMDFMSDEFVAIHHACHAGVKRVLKTDQSLYMYNASGHGAWEAALANLFAAGDTVMIVGHELGAAVIQPAHRALLCLALGGLGHCRRDGRVPALGRREFAADCDGPDRPAALL
jgi:hypothetical protein